MKKILLALIVSSGLSFVASAQSKFSIGPTAGYGWTTVSNINNSKFKAGANFGIATVYSAAEHFGIGLDVKYSIEGAKAETTGAKYELDLHYLRIPLKAIYFFNDHGDKVRPKVFVGPSFGILSSAKENYNGTEDDIKNETESFDLGLTGGAGVNVRLADKTWLNTDLSYYHGIKEIAKTGDYSNKNVILSVGVNFGL
jgi:outer membrane protein W